MQAHWWMEDGMATFWMVDHDTRCLLCQYFATLCTWKVTGYCMEPELTSDEAS